MKKILSLLVSFILLATCIPCTTLVCAEENVYVLSTLSDVQRNSVCILNYLSYLTEEIANQKGNRLYLEEAYSTLYNNIFMNAIDEDTIIKVSRLLDTLFSFEMISTKRERLQYIFEQKQAQAIYNLVPSPFDIMNIVQSGDWASTLISVINTAVNSIVSYETTKNANEMEYLMDGWELDDEECQILQDSRVASIEYMWKIIHDYNLPADLAINKADIENFVKWKNNSNITGRIQFLESNQAVYQGFGEYWLVLAESYFEHEDWGKCLEALDSYVTFSTRIFRKDYHYANVLPSAIIAAKNIYTDEQYISIASQYVDGIIANCDQDDWGLRFFAAVTLAELSSQTGDEAYLKRAYDIVLNNVNILVQEQLDSNKIYLATVQTEKVPADSKKAEIEAYNKGLQETRKTAVPPISEPLMLNCDLLFSLADQLNIDESAKAKINGILHGYSDALFLNPIVNEQFLMGKEANISADSIEVIFDGKEIKIPAMYLTEETRLTVGGLDNKTATFFNIDDWVLKSVERENQSDINSFIATYTSKTASNINYTEGSTVWINFYPVSNTQADTFQFSFNVISKTDFLIPHLVFQRIIN